MFIVKSNLVVCDSVVNVTVSNSDAYLYFDFICNSICKQQITPKRAFSKFRNFLFVKKKQYSTDVLF